MKRLLLVGALLFAAVRIEAETVDFGGHGNKFKGGGDKIPPQCQVSYPRAATEPFAVLWNCVDDNAAQEEIRTELWIYRKGAQAGELIANFLGFPANAQIDAAMLRSADIVSALPVSFKLVAIDRAGITAISPLLTVRAQDNTLDSCTISVETEATESTGGTTGLPAGTVLVENVPVTTSQPDDRHVVIASSSATAATTCEVEKICEDDGKVSFEANVTLLESDAAESTIAISPGAVSAELQGTGTTSDNSLTALELSGETVIDSQNATVELNCKK